MTVKFSHGWKILPFEDGEDVWETPMRTADVPCPGDDCFGCKSDAIDEAHRELMRRPFNG